MAKPIPFTDREMERAWRENLSAFQEAQKMSNAVRLLLFYAVECGLKAAIMRRKGAKRTDSCQEIGEYQHDINKLLDAVHVKGQLRLPRIIQMCGISCSRNSSKNRELNAGQINQMWRYGGSSFSTMTDAGIEEKLLQINEWIRSELG
ncbi:MAG: hypothetical protein ACTFAL_06745 [Candidatus Electronema sp. V4]|uniref:hypothetical protein n=1 Tax=Candidatus Electronema sp. V4 TaxID=3454756 RepID=UPI0040553A6C